MLGRHAKTNVITAGLLLFVLCFEFTSPLLGALLPYIGPSDAEAVNWMCSSDDNRDGFVDAQGETAACIISGNTMHCPIGAANCVEVVSCQNGASYDANNSVCHLSAAHQFPCSVNSTAYNDAASCAAGCVQTAACATGVCPLGSFPCAGLPETCSQAGVCSDTPVCPSGFAYEATRDRCEYFAAPFSNPVCTNNGVYNPLTDRCEVNGTWVNTLCPLNNQSYPDEATCVANCQLTEPCARSGAGLTFSGGGYLNSSVNRVSTVAGTSIIFAHDACMLNWLTGQIDCTPISSVSVSVNGTTVSGVGPSCNDFRSATIAGQSITFARGGCSDSIFFNAYVSGSPFGIEFNGALPSADGTQLIFYNGPNPLGHIQLSQYVCPVAGFGCSGSPSRCTHPQACVSSLVCPTGYAPSGVGDLCIAAAACRSGTLDPARDRCVAAVTYSCPLGNFTCFDNGGTQMCSPPVQCFDLDASLPEDDDVDDTMYRDDGRRDAEGNCLGTIYIFAGRGMRCRPPGVQVGFINDCCESDQPAITDSLGTIDSVQTAITTIQTIYELAQVAYFTNAILVSGVAPSALATASAAVQAATFTGVMNGSVAAGIQSYAAAMINPATIAIAVVVMVVMKILMGNGCDQKDVETALLRDSGMCHYVDDYCARSWPVFGCVQRARGYCCYNTKLARIIHEQGRPQLAGFGIDDWGPGDRPNCRGFTPQEFQSLDFSKIDLSEYFNDIRTRAQADLQQSMMDKLQRFNSNLP